MTKLFLPTLLLLLSACSDSLNELIPAELPEEGTAKASQNSVNEISIKEGEMIHFSTLNLLFSLQEVEDTRCPEDAQCISAGEVSTRIIVQTEQPPLETKDISVCLGCPTNKQNSLHFELGSEKYLLVLKDVKPLPNSDQKDKKLKKTAEFSLEILP